MGELSWLSPLAVDRWRTGYRTSASHCEGVASRLWITEDLTALVVWITSTPEQYELPCACLQELLASRSAWQRHSSDCRLSAAWNQETLELAW